eukprot:c6357_g1_i2.p1 GENE.c6357_g1_i2~~c6357_g1_i2.p1  ORF type:complete len:140 (-),score=23.60 c6357_g1_i2:34-453(-)
MWCQGQCEELLSSQQLLQLNAGPSVAFVDISGILTSLIMPLEPNTFVDMGEISRTLGPTLSLSKLPSILQGKTKTCTTCSAIQGVVTPCKANTDTVCGVPAAAVLVQENTRLAAENDALRNENQQLRSQIAAQGGTPVL